MHSHLVYETLNILFNVVENYAKKNRNRFLIEVLLITLIYSRYTTTICFVLFFQLQLF
jgi:hypothetical protein